VSQIYDLIFSLKVNLWLEYFEFWLIRLKIKKIAGQNHRATFYGLNEQRKRNLVRN